MSVGLWKKVPLCPTPMCVLGQQVASMAFACARLGHEVCGHTHSVLCTWFCLSWGADLHTLASLGRAPQRCCLRVAAALRESGVCVSLIFVSGSEGHSGDNMLPLCHRVQGALAIGSWAA